MHHAPYRMMRSLEVPTADAVRTAEQLAEQGWCVLPEHTTAMDSEGEPMVRLVFGSHESKFTPPRKR